MRKYYMPVATSLIALFILISQNTYAQNHEIYFTTSGVCYLCKIRIEEAVNGLPGIDEVTYDIEKEITYVTYDTGLVDAYMMMQTIADVGHDTEWFPAPDSSYNTLIGTCCEYERTLDYTNVQVGYLSLMDLWVGHLGLNDLYSNMNFEVYPTVGAGLFNFTISGLENYTNYNLSVYSLNGTLAHNSDIEATGQFQINLSHLASGQYIVLLKKDNKIIGRTDLIKK